ncbi:spinster family MFS transporter [Pseudonocardia broussonetiae]|uniref:MFS transporter n=1 Tax=Pseudonocardia broussonetiae TaxID=2736640 RepID=A0A6M6JFZ8_9PSEU|nr:MFS transporter [Pseudonocardia broussonetiae]QJY46065.1 MFS transporter [Pseudonocardia broussonetiae]
MTGPDVVAADEHRHRSRQAPHAWRAVAVLALANLLNFYDRTIPAIVVEPLKAEFGLSDTDVGVLGGAFTVVYAVAGITLGRMADRGSRRRIMAAGLIVWSLFTAASGGAWSIASLLIFRLGVGVGEAAYAPAANSFIADLFPPDRRSRAVAVFQFGLPLGLTLAFFTTGALVEAFDSYRAPFFLAAVPGIVVAVALLLIPEPRRGASETRSVGTGSVARPIRTVLAIPTMWWLILSGIGLQIAAYGVTTFLVPLFQRYFGLSLTQSAVNAGIVLGLTGLVGLALGGAAADRAARRSRRGRLLVAAVSLSLAVPLTLWALSLPPDASGLFVLVFSTGWLQQFTFHTSALPAVSDVVEPRLRATGIALFFAAFYLLGGAFGPVIAGALSDTFAAAAPAGAAGALSSEAVGLHDALRLLVPAALAVAALGMFGASRAVERDHARMNDAMQTSTTRAVP